MSSDADHDYVIEAERAETPDSSQFTTPTDIRDWMEAKADEFAQSHDVGDANPRGRFYVATLLRSTLLISEGYLDSVFECISARFSV